MHAHDTSKLTTSLEIKMSTRYSNIKETGTLSAPSRTLNIQTASSLILQQIKSTSYTVDLSEFKFQGKFNVDNFVDSGYKVYQPKVLFPWVGSVFIQRKIKCRCPMPEYETILKFLRSIFSKLGLNTESCIICLVYIDRLKERNSLLISQENWRPVILAILLVSSKVWDDISVWNVEFAECFPIFGLKMINQMERTMLEALDYQLYISSSEYAKYYFALRSHRMQTQNQGTTIPQPRYYVPIKSKSITRKITIPNQNLHLNPDLYTPLSL